MWFGSDVGQIPELVEKYCRVVKEHTKLPFIAKLTPNVTDIRAIAAALTAAGTQTTLMLVVEVAAGGLLYLALSLAWCLLTHNAEFERLFPKLAR